MFFYGTVEEHAARIVSSERSQRVTNKPSRVLFYFLPRYEKRDSRERVDVSVNTQGPRITQLADRIVYIWAYG